MDIQNQLLLLKQVQQLSFVAVELQLYLDTHPEDQRALTMFNANHSELIQAVRKYEQVYGQILNDGYSPNTQPNWSWVESPWPWEIKY